MSYFNPLTTSGTVGPVRESSLYFARSGTEPRTETELLEIRDVHYDKN